MTLTAQEAKNIAYDSCKSEIEDVLTTIRAAAADKKLSVYITNKLEPVTIEYLRTEGKFRVTGNNKYQHIDISNRGFKYYWKIEFGELKLISYLCKTN